VGDDDLHVSKVRPPCANPLFGGRDG
jgi:hypothetical protein